VVTGKDVTTMAAMVINLGIGYRNPPPPSHHDGGSCRYCDVKIDSDHKVCDDPQCLAMFFGRDGDTEDDTEVPDDVRDGDWR
jgi:hypothetical protein